MKTIDALHDHRKKSTLSGVAIAQQMGVKPKIYNSWIGEGYAPSAERLFRCQEFLVRNGYEIDERMSLPECVRTLRSLMYEGKVDYAQVWKTLGFENEKKFWTFIREGACRTNRKQKCLDLIRELTQSDSEHETPETPETPETGEIPPTSEQSDFDHELEKALDTIVSLGKKFIAMTSQERHAFRQKHPRLFEGSTILGAACSEQAFKNFKAETQS